jgi:cytochrome c oxidase subunit II
MRRYGLLLIALALVAIGVIGLVLLNTGTITLGAPNSDLAARGAVIFNTGNDPDGQPIPYSGGMMMRASCASCHGANGQGLRTPMFVSPNISYRNLTDPAGMVEPDGGHGMKYTDDLIRRVVTQGIDPEDQSLDPVMPRWQLTDAEWSALLAYLKTLP